MLTRTISTLTTKLSLFVGTSIALVAGGVATFVGNTATLPITPQTQTPIKLQTNSKAIRFSDAMPLGTASPEASLAQSSARGLTLATADFDEDGTPDLLSGAINAGVGFVSFHRGNVEAIYPTLRAVEKTAAFFPANRFVNLPAAPDFLVTGDFNADGHQDVLTAARNGSALYLLAGDGKGGFAEAATMELSDAITALASGEINRADGLADVAVAINEREGAKAVLFTSDNGAWNAQPQSFGLARSATSLEFAHLTRDGLSDLAIAAGNELVVLEGAQQTPRMTRTKLSFAADSLAVGRFTDSEHEQIALLANDGSISVASYERVEQRGRQSNRVRANIGWQVASYLSGDATRSESVGSRQLIHAKVSAGKHDDLLRLQGNQIRFVVNNDEPANAAATLEGEGEMIAALPMRMSASAMQGLVVLRNDSATPMAVEPRPEAVFAVDSLLDSPDDNPGDGICRVSTTAPICTLRAAIQEANATAGLDTITFSVGGTFNSSLPLPPITNPIVLDALTNPPTTPVRINSAGQVTFGNILELTGSGNTIRGITFGPATSGFTSISLNSSNDNFIEGCTIQGGGAGIGLQNSSRNTIGGTTTIARNVIGGSFGAGIFISDATSTGNRVLGNYIGLDPTGVRGNGNGVGIVIDLAVNNTIGGTTAASRNVISGNTEEGIELIGNQRIALLSPEAADGNVIQGNYIGVDAAGTGALGNGIGTSIVFPGITIDGASNTTIGGTAAGAGNVIANNGDEGVSILPQGTFIGAQLPLNNAVLGNSIYSNGTLGIDLDAFGITTNDPGDADGGANTRQNFPVLTSALTRTTGTTITGTLNSTASSTFTIEIFSNAACDSSGNGEGETFVTRSTVTTNAAGVANFSIATTTQIPAGRFVTATATNAANNTSEFSACQVAQNAVADLVVTQTATPNPVNVGNNLTYNVTVTNSGPDDATGVSLVNAISIPNGNFSFISVTPSQGSCTGTGPINCNLGTILSTQNATVRIVVSPSVTTVGTPPDSVTATNIATVTSNERDGNTTNNTNATGATVNAVADLAITQNVNISASQSNTVVTYTITIANNGPNIANNISGRFDPPAILTNVTCTAPAGWSCNRDGNPFFVFASRQTPGAPSAAVFTLSGFVGCLPQATGISNTVNVSSSTTDTNTANNTATLNSTLAAGLPTGAVAYDAPNTTALLFGPVIAGNAGTPPSGTFTVRNLGCVPVNLTTAQFVRAGTTSNLAGTDDSRYFSLRLIQGTSEIPLNPTPNPDRNAVQPIPISRSIPAGQSLQFRVVFNPPLPFFAGTFAQRDQGVFASQVLPESFASSLVIGSNATSSLTANITARVSPLAQIIPRDGNSVGSSTTPLVSMETIRTDFRVRVSMYDANKNVTRITYQFFDTFRQPASNPIQVDLTSLLGSSPLLPGQSFTLQQDFSGAAGRPDIVYVRVTVNDGDGANLSATSSPFLPALTSPTATFTEGITSEAFRSDVITLPALRLDGGTGNRPTEPRQETKARREN